ncbi:hypothetical protein PaecuDRAFT_4701 [Paenibacillus curdlanolyticus YK9]|uniref:Uncharacterized protein n=1 Tax=Paenibacillus curdlanolyticus YK9 TaxID=717606 RepID=E0IGA8_9BACL|nr:hypothetical protein [Paenibacillus curdlanolyticus]EFM08510.1 hypothetical protein PaecuDRAFT_4701 [Paenibacillus curdlanolyticus YK9]
MIIFIIAFVLLVLMLSMLDGKLKRQLQNDERIIERLDLLIATIREDKSLIRKGESEK